jgi:hypothetical protein
MFELFYYYSAIAISTSITAYLVIFRPLAKEIQNQQIDCSMFHNPKITMIITLVVSAIVAPLLVPTILFIDVKKFVFEYTEKLKNKQCS